MASVSGPTNPYATSWVGSTTQTQTVASETPLAAGEFTPGTSQSAQSAGLPLPRQLDLEGMLQELRGKLDEQTFKSKLEEVRAQMEAAKVMQLGGLFGAMTDRWMAAGASVETQAEYRQNGVSWWDKQRATQALQQSGLNWHDAQELVEVSDAAMRGDPGAAARLSALAGRLAGSMGVDGFANAMKSLGQMMDSQWGWPLGGKTDDSMNTMLRGLMNSLAVVGTQAFGAAGGAIVASTLVPALAGRYAEDAMSEMGWQGGFWNMNWMEQQSAKADMKADFMLRFGAQVGAMTRQNDPSWQLTGFNAAALGFYGPLGMMAQHAADRQAAGDAWTQPMREARFVNVSGSDERAVEGMLRSAGMDATTADRLGTAVRAKLRGDPNADQMLRTAMAGLQAKGFANFDAIAQKLGALIKARAPGDDGQLLMLRGVMNAMATGGTAAFGPLGGLAVQAHLTGPLADAIANDRRDWNVGGFPFQPFARPREESATQLRMDFARQLGALTRLTADPFPTAAFSPLMLPWVGRLDDFAQAVQGQRLLQADGFQMAQEARRLGVQPWQIDQALSRATAGSDWQTGQMAREAVQSLLSGSPDAAFRMQMLGQRLAAEGPQALQRMLGSLAQALQQPGDPQSKLAMQGLARALAGAATSAFGPMGAAMVQRELALPLATTAAREHLGRMEAAGMLQGLSPFERSRLEGQLVDRELGAQLGRFAAYGSAGLGSARFANLEVMFPQLGAWMGGAFDLTLAQQFRFEARTDMEVRGAQPHQLDQMRSLLTAAGMDRQTAQLAVEAMRLDGANDPRAGAAMDQLAARLRGQGGIAGFQQLLGRLAGRLDDSSSLAGLAQGIAATLTEAGTRAFGIAGGLAASSALALPVATALANRDFMQQFQNGPFARLGGPQREEARQELLAGHLARMQQGLGGIAGAVAVGLDPSHPLHGVDPKSTNPVDYLKSILLAMMQREKTQEELDRVMQSLQDGNSVVMQMLMGKAGGGDVAGGLMLDQRFSMI